MIILDLNQVMISNLLMNVKTSSEIEEDLVRHMILNSIRAYNKKFSPEYGELVIACDDKNYWRKKLFPYYKANRKKNQEKSTLDWFKIFEILNKIREELKEFFPYRVIQIDSAEADDIIATLVIENDNKILTTEKILILSGDKDFIQLHKYANVKQFDPVRKRFITHKNPKSYIKEHIIRGDAGDGIPNFLSPDSCLVTGMRQKPISSKKLEEWLKKDPEEFCDEEMFRNYKRNESLIDLSMIPSEIKEKVVSQYESQDGKKRDKLFNYFVKNRLKNLMEAIGDF